MCYGVNTFSKFSDNKYKDGFDDGLRAAKDDLKKLINMEMIHAKKLGQSQVFLALGSLLNELNK